MQTQKRIKDYTQSESVFNVDTGEDQNIKREIFEVIDMNRALLSWLVLNKEIW